MPPFPDGSRNQTTKPAEAQLASPDDGSTQGALGTPAPRRRLEESAERRPFFPLCKAGPPAQCLEHAGGAPAFPGKLPASSMFKVEQLSLWDVLKTVDDTQRAKVRKLIEDAAAILDRVIETFPAYTLHNSTHAENVVKLMADLLGDRVKDLPPA